MTIGHVTFAALRLARRLSVRLWRVMTWPLRSLYRVLALGWVVGLCIVGAAGSALADQGPIVGPDLAQGAAPTVFEQAPWYGYGLPTIVAPNMGLPERMMWGAINLICLVLNLLSALLVRGALVAMQWMLNLTLYRDNTVEIDTATRTVADAVFWPLIACTIATAGFIIYSRSRRDGGGSIFGEALKIGVLGILAVSFVLAPSNVIGPLDDARTAGSNAIMTGYSNYHLAEGGSAAGFPAVTIPPGHNAPSRKLADAMWNTFIVTPWCYTAFGGEDLCKEWGKEYITKSDRMKKVIADIMVADAVHDINPRDSTPDACVETFKDACDSVRGQTIGRLAAAFVGALVAIPLALLLLVMTLFGLFAAVGVLFLAIIAPVFIVGWMIPGIPRVIGLKWFQMFVGCMIQSAVIAALLGGVMVMGAILQAMIPKYGFWMVGLLNLVVMMTALRTRAMLENVVGAGAGHGGMAGGYLGMKMLAGTGRVARSIGRLGANTAGRFGRGIGAAARHGSGGYMNAGGRGLPAITPSRIKNLDLRRHFPPKAEPGGIATPYRTAPHAQTALPSGSFAQTPQYNGTADAPGYAIAGRTVDALPTATPSSRRALPVGASSLASSNGGGKGAPPAPTIPAKRNEPAQPQAPARTFTSGSTSEAGVVNSAQRRIVHPSRRNIQTPPRPAPRPPVVHWGVADPLVVSRRPGPVSENRSLPPRPPSTPPSPLHRPTGPARPAQTWPRETP